MLKLVDRQVDLTIFLISALAVSIFVKALTLLPERYYFTFSDVVSPENESQFLAQPELPSPTAFCRILRSRDVEASRDETATLSEREADLLEPCDTISSMGDLSYLDFPSYEIVDGQSLNSDQYNNAVADIVSYTKENRDVIAAAMRELEITQERSLDGLSDIDIERIMTANNYFAFYHIIEYLAGSEDANGWRVQDYLTDQSGLGPLLERRNTLEETDREGLRSRPEWIARAEQHRESVLSDQYALIRGAIMREDSFVFLPAIILKLIPAFAIGVLIGLWRPERAVFDTPLAAGFVAFLLCWPVIILWDTIVDDTWKPFQWDFYALYLGYVLTYFFAARLGVLLAIRLRKTKVPAGIASNLDWNSVAATVITTLITSGATAFITWSFANAGQ